MTNLQNPADKETDPLADLTPAADPKGGLLPAAQKLTTEQQASAGSPLETEQISFNFTKVRP